MSTPGRAARTSNARPVIVTGNALSAIVQEARDPGSALTDSVLSPAASVPSSKRPVAVKDSRRAPLASSTPPCCRTRSAAYCATAGARKMSRLGSEPGEVRPVNVAGVVGTSKKRDLVGEHAGAQDNSRRRPTGGDASVLLPHRVPSDEVHVRGSGGRPPAWAVGNGQTTDHMRMRGRLRRRGVVRRKLRVAADAHRGEWHRVGGAGGRKRPHEERQREQPLHERAFASPSSRRSRSSSLVQ